MRDSVATWIRPEVQSLTAYQVPDREGYIKLDAMENPYPWPEELREPWLETLRGLDLNRYPDPDARQLQAQMRHYLGLPDGAGLLLGNGSDELIQLVIMSIAGSGRCVLAPEPTFVMYRLIARFVGLEFIGIPLQADGFGLDPQAMLQAIERHRPAAVFLAYPNNPTGNLFSRTEIEAIVAASDGLVVIDEAYFNFAESTFIPDLTRHENLLVLRTLSKIGLAGLRVGALVGAPDWIEQINKLRLPYNLGLLSQVSTCFMLTHAEVLMGQVRRICADREELFQQITALASVKVWPSQTNFLTLRVPDPENTNNGLLANGILIKKLHGAHALLEGCLRVTIGAPGDNRVLIEALRSLV